MSLGVNFLLIFGGVFLFSFFFFFVLFFVRRERLEVDFSFGCLWFFPFLWKGEGVKRDSKGKKMERRPLLDDTKIK